MPHAEAAAVTVEAAVRQFRPGERLVALPSWRAPRLIVPAEPASVRRRAGSFYPAYLPAGRLVRRALLAWNRIGLTATRTAPPDARSLVERLRAWWPHAETLSVRLGTPGPAQKWTARVHAEDGRVLGYAKSGELPAAVARVEAEAAVLPQVPRGRGPGIVWLGLWNEAPLLVTTPVPGWPVGTTVEAEALGAFGEALVYGEPLALHAHPWVQALDPPPTIAEALDALSDARWPVCLQHGDLAPWNLHVGPGGTLAAYDWECGHPGALPHLDEAYYVLHTGYHLRLQPPADALRSAVRHLTERRLRPHHAEALARLAAYDAHRKAEPIGEDPRLQHWQRCIWATEPAG